MSVAQCFFSCCFFNLGLLFLLQAVVNRVKEVAAAVQELKTRRVLEEKQEEHPSDVAFSKQADSVSHACMDLSQQVNLRKLQRYHELLQWIVTHIVA